MSLTDCPKCAAKVDDANNFCGSCGAVISQPQLDIANSDSTAAALTKAIQLTMRDGPDTEQLEAYSAAVTMESLADEMALAWAFKMRCHARLGQLADAQDARRRARRYYAAHLGLRGETLEQYLADASYMDSDISLNDASENPWMYYLFKFSSPFSTSPYMKEGDSDEVRNNHAMRSWTYFADDKDELLKLLGILQMRAGRHRQAAEIFEGILRRPDSQGEELRAEMRSGLVWINFFAAECYDALGDRGQAINKWQQARSFEFLRDSDPEVFDILVSGWVKKAKDALRDRGAALRTLEDSRLAATHLASAWQWMGRAEAETQGLDMYQFATKLKNPDNNFNRCTVAAERELQVVERCDPFARALVLAGDGETRLWIRHDMVKGEILRFRGLIHLGVDDFNPAIAALKMSLEVWPSLATYFWLGFAYEGRGDIGEARKCFRLCIERTDELADFLEDEEERANTKQMAIALMSELPGEKVIGSVYIYRNGRQEGPYPIERVRAWLASGQLQANDLAWYEGAVNWMPVSFVAGAGGT
jgi:tetratricopeptide (TPR) repeat protein